MPRRRRYYRRSRAIKTVKYSSENTQFSLLLPTFTGPGTTEDNSLVSIISPIESQGVRKVKNISLSFTPMAVPYAIAWALVYVPEGVAPSSLRISKAPTGETGTAVSMYEPNQNVILAGIVPPSNAATNNSPSTIRRTRLARNLNSGDQIMLILKYIASAAYEESPRYIFGVCNYAICYN